MSSAFSSQLLSTEPEFDFTQSTKRYRSSIPFFVLFMHTVSYPPEIEEIITILSSLSHKAYIVGGCVRDSLLNLPIHDYDITTSASPEQVMDAFPHSIVIPTGLKHGTVTVVTDIGNVEITTFRTDGDYIHHRRPQSVTFSSSFMNDASRRDFTMNALAYNSQEGIIDYFGGIDDILSKTIRTVGDPYKRFDEDALRILRAIRFSATLGFDIESKTSAAIHCMKELLCDISAERLSSEFLRLITGKNTHSVLNEYSDVIAVFIPQITPMMGFCQHNHHHIYDVWQHTLKAVEAAPQNKISRLAAFFHDIGKPKVFSLSPDGIGHFYGHSTASCQIAEDVMHRLRLDNATVSAVLTIIKYHDLQVDEDKKSVRRLLSRLGEEAFFQLLDMFRCDTAALAPQYSIRYAHFDALESIARELLSEAPCFSIKSLAINGNDIINLGIPQGKKVGEILNAAFSAVLNEEIPNEKNAILKYISETFSNYVQ